MTETVITVEDLRKEFSVPKRGEGFFEAVKSLFNRQFEEKVAVDDISFSIDRGEIVGLLGPNGAGKSTTIKMLTGILKETGGSVEALGYYPFEDRAEYVKHIGALFGQKSQLWWDIPALDAYALSQHLYDIPRDEFVSWRDELIRRLGIADVVEKPVRNLSLGERMKCEFVMALLHKPDIVYLDEPTIGLDVFAKEAIREFVKEVNAEYDTTFILTTHDMDDVEHLAERVIVISDGRIVFDDSLDALKKVSGDKKDVRIVTEDELPGLPEGVENVRKASSYDATFTLDCTQTSLQALVDHVTQHTSILDLAVSDPDVEQLIKTLYKQ